MSRVLLISLTVFTAHLIYEVFHHHKPSDLDTIILVQMYLTYFIVKAIELKK